MPEPVEMILYIVAGLAALAAGWLLVQVAPWWVTARRARTPLGVVEITAMRLRKVPLAPVVGALAAAKQAGLDVFIGSIETHAFAGGDPEAAIAGFGEARRGGDDVALEEVLALDLAGYDVVALARDGEPLAGLIGSPRAAALGDRYRKAGR